MYKCPCGAIHADREWNAATLDHYKTDIMLIGDVDADTADFKCPTCGKKYDRCDLSKVTRRPKEDGRDTDETT